jgi:hypothetical protein
MVADFPIILFFIIVFSPIQEFEIILFLTDFHPAPRKNEYFLSVSFRHLLFFSRFKISQ